MKVESVPVEHLSPHPDNPRGKIAPVDVAELADAIEARGLLSPLVVRPAPKAEGRWQVLSGHRRLAALKTLKAPTAFVHVVHADDGEAAAIMLAENIHREDLDPFRTAVLVDAMSKREGATVKSVAESLGKTVRWVAQRRAIATLSPAWRKAHDDEKSAIARWSVPMLVAVAELVPEVQDAVLQQMEDQDWIQDEKDVRQQLGSRLHRLKDASWDLADEVLVPAAGSCAKCPKQSQHAPGLFEETGDAGDVKAATCRDAACWAVKAAASVKRKAAQAREKHGKDLVLVTGPGGGFDVGERKPAGALDTYQYKPSKQGAPGAKPALIVSGKGEGTVTWVKPNPKPRSVASSYSSPATPKLTAAETLALKRVSHACDLAGEAARKVKCPKDSNVVLGLVLAYGLYADASGTKEVRDAYAKGIRGPAAFAAEAWDLMREEIVAAFDVGYYEQRSAKTAEGHRLESEWLAGELGIPWKDYWAAALQRFPDPKLSVEAKQKKPAKPKKAAKAKRELAGAKA